jgi:hypothetical protein
LKELREGPPARRSGSPATGRGRRALMAHGRPAFRPASLGAGQAHRCRLPDPPLRSRLAGGSAPGQGFL